MARDRYIRKTYAGNPVRRHPLYPGLLRRGRGVAATGTMARLAVQIVVVVAILASALTAVAATSAYGTYAQVAASLTPRLDELTNHRPDFQTSRIYDRNGTLLYEFFDAGKRTKISLADVSPLLINATIAIEDKTFFTNTGVDYEGIARTLYSSLTVGEETGGASTITQQVIKNIIFTDEERSYENRYQRKINEIIMAQELNKRYSKEQILEIYLNEIFYGNLAYGIEAASEVYFKTRAKDLTLAQATLLAGLPQLPSRYNPINYLQRDDQGGFLPGLRLDDEWLSSSYSLPNDIPPPKWRQTAVLRQMVEEGYVTESQARAALAEDLRFADQEVPLNAPHFVFYVRDLLEEKYGQQLINGGGLSIYTTLDLDMQRMVQQKAAERIAELEARNIHNAAVVVMQPRTGQILAMVGSIDYNAIVSTSTPGQRGNVLDGQVNVATRERQPGSALKPFTYVAAMEQGMTPASILWDVPTEFPLTNGEWYAPLNYNGRWNGPVQIRTALANSLNMPAVKALKFAGVDYTLSLLDRAGIKTGLKRGAGFYGLSLTLGGGEVTPLELTTAYNTLASEGRYTPPTPILKITDGDGQVLEAYQPKPGQQVVDAGIVSIITDMMSDDQARAAIWGRNSKLKLSRPAAVKTGTSNDWRDAWTLGFTPYVTVGVWSGNNNNEPTSKVESLEGGGIIWGNVMEEVFTWIDNDPKYRELFSEPFPDNGLPLEFAAPANFGVEREAICRLPGPFGGYNEELFTKEMLSANAQPAATDASGTSQPRLQGRIGGACDIYKTFTVVRIPSAAPEPQGEEDTQTSSRSTAGYCLPAAGENYPPNMLETITVWNLPPKDPSERVQYRWSGGGASLNPNNLPTCSFSMFVTPTPAPTFTPAPPVAGAVRMPNLIRLGENQAKEVLQRMGITAIYVDYQTRERIPNAYDQFVPYSIVSTQPAEGEWIIPGTTVVLGVRAPDPQPTAPPQPEAPQPEAPQPEAPQPVPQPEAPQPAPPEPEAPPIIVPQPAATPLPLPGLRPPGGRS